MLLPARLLHGVGRFRSAFYIIKPVVYAEYIRSPTKKTFCVHAMAKKK
jgi:hypothetical protein